MALLLCERQQNWLRAVTVVFITIDITFTFLRLFSKSKKSRLFTFFAVFRTFSRTMPVIIGQYRRQELCYLLL